MPVKHPRRFASVILASTLAVLLVGSGSAFAAGADAKPIPGGLQFGEDFIHVFAPGPVDLGLMGENVEPNTITDFTGFSALAYVVGTATDADGNTYTMVNDIRVFSGTYVSEDGSVLHGTFAFI
jgi:hypothetical protein